MRLLTWNSNKEVVLSGPYRRDTLPPYTILSHTWGADDDEVTFADLQAGHATIKSGYKKILFCAEQTQKDEIAHFWIDTCCINKDSSAERSEAINSMYKWYRDAKKCYVYLSDVTANQKDNVENGRPIQRSVFGTSRWFTRGWTLQELLAPAVVEFFAHDGTFLGTKQTLADQICEVTELPPAALFSTDLSHFPIGQRWRWAHGRQTSEPEDKAYCLLGIFNVFLPLIYGEGEHAWFRLQEAVKDRSKGEHHFPISNSHSASTPFPRLCTDATQNDHGDEYEHRPVKRQRTGQNRVSDTTTRLRVEHVAAVHTQSQHSATKYCQQYDQDKYESLYKSLRFKGFDFRVKNVKGAMLSTCKWLLDREDFQKWYHGDETDQQSGFFWIKGKPGCGKSTLMKAALEWARKKGPRTHVPRLTVPYFFNARASTSLEKSALGLYRNIVYHLLCTYEALRPIFMDRFLYRDTESEEDWTMEELQDFLRDSVESRVAFELCLFIDALDEAEHESDVRQMIHFLVDLSDRSLAARGACQLQICLSSRHYPHITIGRGLSLIVEDQPGHGRDIQAYIGKYLTNAEHPEKQSLRASILRKAAHIFLWVVLVVDILNKSHDQGASSSDLQACVEALPANLSELFQEILLRSNEGIESTVLFFQWSVFSTRPLEAAELFVAMEYSRSPADSTWMPSSTITPPVPDALARRVLDYSRGLVELVEVGSGQQPVIQFIHETVREFLVMDNGLKSIVPALATNLAGISHGILRIACFRCISCHNVPDEYQHYANKGHTSNVALKLFTSSVRRESPFLDYAVLNLFEHGEQAQQHGIHQQAFLEKQIGLQGEWIDPFRLCWNVLARYKVDQVKSNDLLINFLIKQRHFGLSRALFNMSDTTRSGAIERNTLKLASVQGHAEIVQLLLETPTDIVPKQNVLDQALAGALKRGRDKVVQILLDNGADISTQSGVYGSALQAASLWGHDKIVQILLDNGVDVNAQVGSYGSALQAASRNGYEKIVQALLDNGVDVNAREGLHSSNALHIASANGHEKIVQILLDSGADVNARGGTYGSALNAASVHGHEKIVQILLNNGADVNAQGGIYGSALQAASLWGHDKIVQILLDNSADVNVQVGYYGSAPQAASRNGCEKIVQILLDNGADVNAQGGVYGSALQAASEWGHENIVQILLDHGAEATAPKGGTP